MPELVRLGWTDDFAAAFAPHASAGLVPGRVSLEHNQIYRVLTADGEVLAEATGKMKHEAAGRQELPAVGDWVALRPAAAGERTTIQAILPRRTQFSRKVAGRETLEQVLAANVDTVLLVAGLDHDPKARSLERYLVLTKRSGAQPVVVLNKTDVIHPEDLALALEDVRAVVGDTPVHTVSARSGAGMEALQQYLQEGKTVALLGPSGAGKSTIVNRLAGNEELATGDVRARDLRGRHTSVHRHLIVLAQGGLMIDTPGLRELQLWEPDAAVDDTFDDISALSANCRFRDCRHDREPGCAVKAAVEAQTIAADRYDSYLTLQREREAFEKRTDERAQLEAKRQTRIRQNAYRSFQKGRGKA